MREYRVDARAPPWNGVRPRFAFSRFETGVRRYSLRRGIGHVDHASRSERRVRKSAQGMTWVAARAVRVTGRCTPTLLGERAMIRLLRLGLCCAALLLGPVNASAGQDLEKTYP